jgi:hypothetical protein
MSCAVLLRGSVSRAVRRNQPLPLAVVRDLLGITRALYRAERAKPQPDARMLGTLETIGRQLGQALELGKGAPGSMGARAAWGWAEKGCEALAVLVADLELAPAVRATIERLER